MRISFKNFAKATDGDVELNKLTIICGPNGTGKTYTSYAVYGALQHFSELFEFGISDEEIKALSEGVPVKFSISHELENFSARLKDAALRFKKGLDDYFSAPSGFFQNAEFSFFLDNSELHPNEAFSRTVNISKDMKIDFEMIEGSGELNAVYSGGGSERLPRQALRRIVSETISDCIFGKSIPVPFVVTSERTGVALFYKELDVNKNAILSQLASGEKIDPLKLLQSMQSRYARPIQHNIDVVREYGVLSKKKSFIREERETFSYVYEAWNELVGGSFRDDNNQLTYTPRKERNKPRVNIPLYITSSSVKSLFLIDMYINFIAERNGLLIIDEPELNLHPDNQVRMARFIARLVSAGVKVLVTTHSDYFVREVNNLIALSSISNGQQELMRRYNYRSEDILSAHDVTAYCATPGRGIEKMTILPSGIDAKIFDNIINQESVKAQDIYFSIERSDEG